MKVLKDTNNRYIFKDDYSNILDIVHTKKNVFALAIKKDITGIDTKGFKHEIIFSGTLDELVNKLCQNHQ